MHPHEAIAGQRATQRIQQLRYLEFLLADDRCEEQLESFLRAIVLMSTEEVAAQSDVRFRSVSAVAAARQPRISGPIQRGDITPN